MPRRCAAQHARINFTVVCHAIEAFIVAWTSDNSKCYLQAILKHQSNNGMRQNLRQSGNRASRT
eukprot:1847849-Amphidinium_carterae.2